MKSINTVVETSLRNRLALMEFALVVDELTTNHKGCDTAVGEMLGQLPFQIISSMIPIRIMHVLIGILYRDNRACTQTSASTGEDNIRTLSKVLSHYLKG